MQKNLKKAVWLSVILSFALGITVSRIHQQQKTIYALEAESFLAYRTSFTIDLSIKDQLNQLQEDLLELEEMKEEQMEDLKEELEEIRETILEDIKEIRIEL